MRADSLQVDDLIRKLKDAKMDLTAANYDAKAVAAQFASGEKVGTVSTTDNTGTQTVEIHKSKDKDGGYYAKSTAVAGIYKVAGDLGDSLAKSVDDYRNKKLFDFGFNDPTKLEINGTTYQKSADKWTSGSTPYEAGTRAGCDRQAAGSERVEIFGKNERHANAHGRPSLRVTNTDMRKSPSTRTGTAYDAQRDGEPAVYVLDAKDVDDLQKAIAGIKQQLPAEKSASSKKK